MTKLFLKPAGTLDQSLISEPRCLSLGFFFFFPRSDYWFHSSNKREQGVLSQLFLPSPSVFPSLLLPPLLISLPCGWSLSLWTEQDSINRASCWFRAEGSGQVGRRRRRSGSGKDMSKCMWRSPPVTLLPQEHNNRIILLLPPFLVAFLLLILTACVPVCLSVRLSASNFIYIFIMNLPLSVSEFITLHTHQPVPE